MVEDISAPWVPGNPNDRSIEGFRIRHGGKRGAMSRKFYKTMKDDGIGPRETVIGNLTIITVSDELAWEQARANPTGTEAEIVAKRREWRHKRAVKAGKAAAASPKHISKRRRQKKMSPAQEGAGLRKYEGR